MMSLKKIMIGLIFFALSADMIPADAFADSSETEITLDQAVRYALEHSPDMQSARTEITRREGVAASARAGLLPQIDIFGDMNRTYTDHAFPPATAPQVIRFDDMIYTAGAELKLLVWDFGQTAHELSAARERIHSAESLLARRQQEVLYTTASLYLKTLTYNDLMDAAASSRKSLQALLGQTTELADAGRAVPADVLKVTTRLAQIESDLASLEAGRQISISQLSAVMGWEGELPRLQYTPPDSDAVPSQENTETLILKAMSHRPDISALESEIQAALNQQTAAQSSRWPRTELRAGAYEYAASDPVSSLGNWGPKPDNTVGDWAIGIRITFPLFDSGKRNGQIQSAAAQTELARAAGRKLRLEIEKEVRSALADLESAQKRIQATRQSVAQAEEVLRNEKLKYEAGRGVINFVLDAEAALLTNQSLLRQALRAMRIAQLVLDLSTGNMDLASVSSP